MAKPQNVEKKNGNQAKAIKAKSVQEGQIKKNKQQKTKQTPAGKVALINGNSNGKNVQKKPAQSPAKTSPVKKSPQQQQQQPQGQGKKNKNQKQQQQKAQPAKKEVQKKKPVEEKEDDSDIDEGIPSIQEDISMNGSEDDSDDESGDDLDIFGQSLADDSDDDDEDFDDDDEEEEEKSKVKNGKKGIKPFKGINAKSEEEEEDDDDDDDEDDDEDTDAMDTTGASSLNSSATENDDDDSEDDDDDDDDSEDDSKTGLKALMGDSLVDDENDEDFEEDDEEDDDDISEESEATELNQSATSPTKSVNGEKVVLTDEEKAELDKRTIFVGNVPMAVEEKKIKATFKTFGAIESIRFRGVVGESPNLPLKVVSIKKKFHPKVTAKCAFVVFKSAESAAKALSLNGTKLDGNYLRVDLAAEDRKVDAKKAVFLGNMHFQTEDNEIWEMFGKCGKIDWVRTIRDRKSGLCRGIAYVNFKNEDSVALALNLNGQLLKNRPIRVTRYKSTEKKPRHAAGQKRPRSNADNAGSPVKKAKQAAVEQATKNSQNAERRKEQKAKRSQGEKQRTQKTGGKEQASPKAKDAFQGQKAENKKNSKKGGNKFEKKKQHMAAKLTAKPKKPVK